MELFAAWGIVVLTWIQGELDVVPNGALAAHGQQFDFCVDVVLILMMIISVPLALRLFSLNTQRSLRRMDKDEALSSYHRWSLVRLLLLWFCAEAGVLVYFLLMDDKGIFCACIALVATFFCVPSARKVKRFLNSLNKESEEQIDQ